MSDLLEVGQVGSEQRRSEAEEVAVSRVVDLDHAPGVLAGPDELAANLDLVFRADDGEREESLWDGATGPSASTRRVNDDQASPPGAQSSRQ